MLIFRQAESVPPIVEEAIQVGARVFTARLQPDLTVVLRGFVAHHGVMNGLRNPVA